MIQLKINNIGPIKKGSMSENNYIDFNKITLLIGNQGSGKSTVAKIYSTLSWIEKALVRGDFSAKYIVLSNRFKKHFDYQGISSYFNDRSRIEYIGKAFTIKYQDNRLDIKANSGQSDYKFPKIMYIPAERNFVSSVERPDLLKRLPLPLYTFLDEYENAKSSLEDSLPLPIGNIDFEYRKQNKKSMLVGDDFKIDLLEASSGFQSVVPLFIVTKHLARRITENGESTRKEISVDEEKRIRTEIDTILNNKNISNDVRKVLIERISDRYQYASFINIVEEPEQNLYPVSQKEILYELLKSRNTKEDNTLTITTHSPYILNYLNLAIKANSVKAKAGNSGDLLKKLSDIVPLESLVDPSMVSIYQINDRGEIIKLPDYDGLPSDENYLNDFLAQSNDLFIKLMELEDKCQ